VFSDKPHSEGLPRLFYLRQGLVPRFLAAAREMNDRGWILKVEDGYRTLTMQRGLSLKRDIFLAVLDKVRWECGQTMPPGDLLFRRLAALVANAPKVGTHMSGSAMDISVLNRDSGEEVDRGAPYLEMSERTPMGSPFVSAAAREARGQITALMARHGFSTYPWEFWHYNATMPMPKRFAVLVNRPGTALCIWIRQPARCGGRRPNRLLHSEVEIRLLMEEILAASE
jgi:D-alanyl-D-alanine dipeptidase